MVAPIFSHSPLLVVSASSGVVPLALATLVKDPKVGQKRACDNYCKELSRSDLTSESGRKVNRKQGHAPERSRTREGDWSGRGRGGNDQ